MKNSIIRSAYGGLKNQFKKIVLKKRLKISIKIPVPRWEIVQEWGDYHLALGLKNELEKKGCDVLLHVVPEWYNNSDADCDIVLALRGLNRYNPKKQHFNVMWNISHPDLVSVEEYNEFDYVFIASDIWANELKSKLNVPVESLIQCTDPELFYFEPSDEYKHDLLFVGNSRNIFRKIVKDLLPTDKDFGLYGTQWDQFIDKKYISGDHISNIELHKAYSSCKILLNDHWEDMAEKGFISNRLFDGFAAGAFIISDEIKGAENIFGDALVTYSDANDLQELIDYYLTNNLERVKKIEKGREIVLANHTFAKRAERILDVIKKRNHNDTMKKISSLEKRDEQIKEFKSQNSNTIVNFHEEGYLNNRSAIKRLISMFPSLYILFNKNKGIKNTFVNINGYNAIKKNHLLDVDYYLKNNKDVRLSGMDPVLHYMYHGFKEGRKPSSRFDGNYYLKRYKDVKKSNLNPLVHYSLYGIKEGRKTEKPKKKIKEGRKTKKPKKRAKKNFNDFSGFLANSLVSPLLRAPFREEDKRCFSMMENVAKYLVNLACTVEDTTLVSVIMPVYNRVDVVKSAVDSILNQTYRNIELIIVDDGSDDGSTELLEKINDERIILLRNETCQGVSSARNRALAAANGKYIAYLDSDNTWDSRYIAVMVGAFLELPDADALYSGQLLFKGNAEKPFAVRFGSFNKSLLANRNYIDINAFCHTHDLYQRLGGFDESLRRYVDWDLIMRVAETSKMYSVPVLLSYYYYDKAKNTITNDKTLIQYYKIMRKEQNERSSKAKLAALNSSEVLTKGVSIVIPSYEALKDIQECIDSIMMRGSNWLEIIVVDNASSQPVVNYLEGLESEGKIKFIQNDTNYGFTYAVNQGIAIAKPDNDIIILNNDAVITPGAIEAMQKAAYELPQCGMVVPQQVLPGGTRTIGTHVPYADPKYECDVNLSAIHANIINVPLFHSGESLELSFAPFFCAYIKRDVLDRSVGLDAEFGRHYRSDRIFCNYMRHVMKLKIYHVSEAVVYHKLQRSTKVLHEESDKNSDFDIIFFKNQWDAESAAQLDYKTAIWDF